MAPVLAGTRAVSTMGETPGWDEASHPTQGWHHPILNAICPARPGSSPSASPCRCTAVPPPPIRSTCSGTPFRRGSPSDSARSRTGRSGPPPPTRTPSSAGTGCRRGRRHRGLPTAVSRSCALPDSAGRPVLDSLTTCHDNGQCSCESLRARTLPTPFMAGIQTAAVIQLCLW